jgi:hypothetical protein
MRPLGIPNWVSALTKFLLILLAYLLFPTDGGVGKDEDKLKLTERQAGVDAEH